MTEAARPARQEELWAGPLGERWLSSLKRFESMMSPIGEALLEAAAIRPGEHVLDVGSGGGATTLEIARRVGPIGSALGLDISPALVAAARRRAIESQLENVAFQLGNAATAALDQGTRDLLFSRFGTMFFEDPYAAFTSLRQALKPGGRLALACWAPVSHNLWMMELRTVLARYVELPLPVPRAPSPTAFEDEEYLRDILARAGFTDVRHRLWQSQQSIGGPGTDPEAAATFMLEAMPMADALAEAPGETMAAAYADLVETLGRYHTPDGVRMPAATWLVTARAKETSTG